MRAIQWPALCREDCSTGSGQKSQAIAFYDAHWSAIQATQGCTIIWAWFSGALRESAQAEISLAGGGSLESNRPRDPRQPRSESCSLRTSLPESREAYSQCLRLCPNHPAALEGLGDVSLRENRKPAAEHFYRSALRAGSSSAPLLNKLANLLAQRGLSAEAEECYRRALALDPGFADAHFNLGSACGRAGRTQEALHHLRQAVALKSNFKEAWETLAMTLEEENDLQEALACWERVLELDPGWIKGRWASSLTLLKMGRLLEGFASYECRFQIPELIPPREFSAPALDRAALRKANAADYCRARLG